MHPDDDKEVFTQSHVAEARPLSHAEMAEQAANAGNHALAAHHHSMAASEFAMKAANHASSAHSHAQAEAERHHHATVR